MFLSLSGYSFNQLQSRFQINEFLMGDSEVHSVNLRPVEDIVPFI